MAVVALCCTCSLLSSSMTLLLTEGSRASSSKAVRQVEKHTTQRAEDDEGIRPLKDKSVKDSAVETMGRKNHKRCVYYFFLNLELPRATLFTIMVATSISNDNNVHGISLVNQYICEFGGIRTPTLDLKYIP